MSGLRYDPLSDERAEPRSEADYVSFWTPLHQAALLRAPNHVVSRLTAAGAMSMRRPARIFRSIC